MVYVIYSVLELSFNNFTTTHAYGQGRSLDVRGPMLFSVEPAVCCVYLNSRE